MYVDKKVAVLEEWENEIPDICEEVPNARTWRKVMIEVQVRQAKALGKTSG